MKNACIAALLAILAACAPAPEGGGPSTEKTFPIDRASMDAGVKDTVDLGALRTGAIAEYSVYLKNSDDQAFIILDVSTDCGCTRLEYDKKPVSPGDSVRIGLHYHSAGQFGRQMKKISVLTTLSGLPKELVLTARVER